MLDGTKVVNIRAHSKKKRKATIKYSSLINLLFPKTHLNLLSYGRGYSNFQLLAFGSYSATQKNISCTAGNTQWYEFYHLPWNSSDGIIATGQTIEALMVKQSENATISPNRGYATGNGGSGQHRNPFCYLGGRTTHTFKNFGNQVATLQIRVARPRRPMRIDLTQTSTNTPAQILGPTSTSLRDKNYAGTWTDAIAPTNDINAIDQCTDKMFNYSIKDKALNYNYVLSPVRIIKLAPGDTCNYSLDHPPFQWDEFLMQQALATAYKSGAPDTYTPQYPNLQPFATQILIVRVQGTLDHESVNTANNTVEDYGVVNYGPAHLSHHQHERHSFRAMPPANLDATITQDLLTGVAVEGINPETNEDQLFEDD